MPLGKGIIWHSFCWLSSQLTRSKKRLVYIARGEERLQREQKKCMFPNTAKDKIRCRKKPCLPKLLPTLE